MGGAASATPLSAEEVARYHRDGQLTPAWRLSPSRLEALRAAVLRLLAARADVRPGFIALPHVPWDDAEGSALAREFFEFFSDPQLLDVVEQIIGPDIILWASALFCKPAATGLEVPWHQDGQYWPIRPRATVTVWIALDDVRVDNGCMRVIPGSHRMGEFSHDTSPREDLVLNQVLNDPRIDLARVRNIELEPGQLSLHDVELVHGSQANTSGRRRAGLAVRYMPSTSLYDRTLTMGGASQTAPVEFKQRPIWLLRGVDRCGANDFVTGHVHW